MFVVSKIFNFVLFPPSIFIVILLLALIMMIKSRKKAAIIILFDIILIYALSIEPIKDFILKPLESYAEPLDLNKKIDADFTVILGGGTIDFSPEEGYTGSLSTDAIKRTMYGTYISEITAKPIIFSGGIVFDNQKESEAEVAEKIIKRYQKKNIAIYKEDKSRTTFENAMLIKEKFKPKRIILGPSAYHMKRSLYSFKRAGIECIPAPTDYKINGSKYNFTSYIPKAGDMEDTTKGLKEYLGLLYYMVK